MSAGNSFGTNQKQVDLQRSTGGMTEDVNKTILKTDIENEYLKPRSVHSDHALRVAGSSTTYMCKYLQQMVPPFTASARRFTTGFHELSYQLRN